MPTQTSPTITPHSEAEPIIDSKPPRPRSIITQCFPNFAIWSANNLTGPGVNSFSGGVAGIISGVATCPLDVIKTKLQNQSQANHDIPKNRRPPPLYKGLIGTAKVIHRQEGFAGFYRGVKPMVLGYIPTWAIYMPVYDSTRQFLYDHGWGEQESDKWFARLYASVTAGFCGSVLTSPIWVIKTRYMAMVSPSAEQGAGNTKSRPTYHYTGTLDAARQMYREGGIRVFYAGLVPGLLGLSHVAIQFPLYEYFKREFTGSEMGATATPSSSSDAASNTFGILAAGFISKLCATTATYPHEVLRTRQQTQMRTAMVENNSAAPKYLGIAQTFKLILREEGWRAFYNGMGTNMIRAIPAAMTTMLAFETIKSFIGQVQEEGRELVAEGR